MRTGMGLAASILPCPATVRGASPNAVRSTSAELTVDAPPRPRDHVGGERDGDTVRGLVVDAQEGVAVGATLRGPALRMDHRRTAIDVNSDQVR